jgi:hypothetical protein
MQSRIVLLAAVAAFAVSAVPATAAYAQGVSQRDEAELKAYRLSMEKIRKFAAAGEAMVKAIEADPRFKATAALKKEIEALQNKDELTAAEEKRLDDLRAKLEAEEAKNDGQENDNNAQSLDDMARRIEKIPALAAAIRSAGLTPREYSLLSLATMQAMMAHGFQKASGGKELPKEIAATVLADNIKFIADNEAEIMRIMERLKALEDKDR